MNFWYFKGKKIAIYERIAEPGIRSNVPVFQNHSSSNNNNNNNIKTLSLIWNYGCFKHRSFFRLNF